MTPRFRSLVSVICGGAGILSAAVPAAAQDAHYWTLQYGPRSSLLGGAVIGSVDDVSGTFYNPGAVSQAEDLAFAVSTDVFEYSGVRLEDGSNMAKISRDVLDLVGQAPDAHVLYPVHPNPNVRGPAEELLAFTVSLGFDLHRAVRFAVATASLSCGGYGGRQGLPDKAQALAVTAQIKEEIVCTPR